MLNNLLCYAVDSGDLDDFIFANEDWHDSER